MKSSLAVFEAVSNWHATENDQEEGEFDRGSGKGRAGRPALIVIVLLFLRLAIANFRRVSWMGMGF